MHPPHPPFPVKQQDSQEQFLDSLLATHAPCSNLSAIQLTWLYNSADVADIIQLYKIRIDTNFRLNALSEVFLE